MHVEGLDGLTGEEVRTVLDRWPRAETVVRGGNID